MFISSVEHRIRPNVRPIRKYNIFPAFAVNVIHKFSTYSDIFCSSVGDKFKIVLASTVLNRLAVLKTVTPFNHGLSVHSYRSLSSFVIASIPCFNCRE